MARVSSEKLPALIGTLGVCAEKHELRTIHFQREGFGPPSHLLHKDGDSALQIQALFGPFATWSGMAKATSERGFFLSLSGRSTAKHLPESGV